MTNHPRARQFWNYVLHAVGIPAAIAIVGLIVALGVGGGNDDPSEGLIQLILIAGLFLLAAGIYAAVYQIWWWVTRVEEHLELTRQIAQAHRPKTQEPSEAREMPPYAHENRRTSATHQSDNASAPNSEKTPEQPHALAHQAATEAQTRREKPSRKPPDKLINDVAGGVIAVVAVLAIVFWIIQAFSGGTGSGGTGPRPPCNAGPLDGAGNYTTFNYDDARCIPTSR